MSKPEEKKYPFSWEEAIDLLRETPEHQALVRDAYLTADLVGNAERFAASAEFIETLRLIKSAHPEAKDVLDIPGGNGIATHAFAAAGFNVTTVEPDASDSVGRGAIKTVIGTKGLQADIVEAYGEDLPFGDASFDVVYVRQGLHHAHDLGKMLQEYSRVLRPSGLLVACREHVVDDYDKSLQAFLDKQVDHKLYGGEHAFTLVDYRDAMNVAGLAIEQELEPYDTVINLHPNTLEGLGKKIRGSRAGKLLGVILPGSMVEKIGMWQLKRSNLPGRLYSFVARKKA